MTVSRSRSVNDDRIKLLFAYFDCWNIGFRVISAFGATGGLAHAFYGEDAKGLRQYGWTRMPLLSWQMTGERRLLLRRSLTGESEATRYVAYTPADCDL
jgi:hypothetical protein